MRALSVAALVVALGAPAVATATALLPARAAQAGSVAGAEEDLAAATAAYRQARGDQDEAATRLDAAQAAAVAAEAELRAMNAQQREVVLAYEATLRRARDAAVAAYVRGGNQADLHAYLDADRATEAILRTHLAVGRVDQAREAAADLRTARSEADDEVRARAQAVAATGAELTSAIDGVRAADRVALAAYEEVLAAEAALAEAEAAEAAAAAEAARQQANAQAQQQADDAARAAAAAAAAAASRASTGGGGGSGGGDRGTVSPPPQGSGDSDGWAELRDCESGGNYRAVSADGQYRGAYQFDQETWEAMGGTGDPAAASPEEQDYRAKLLYAQRGSSPWPLCGRSLP